MSFFDPEQEDKLKEECGVFGIYNPDGSAAAPSIYYGLSALQHRGQEGVKAVLKGVERALD